MRRILIHILLVAVTHTCFSSALCCYPIKGKPLVNKQIAAKEIEEDIRPMDLLQLKFN